MQDMQDIIEAADAVIARWDSPLWNQHVHTGEFINNLRVAVDREKRYIKYCNRFNDSVKDISE